MTDECKLVYHPQIILIMKRLIIITISILMCIGICSYISKNVKESLTIFNINGDICFTHKYDKDADICIPAAYATKEGAIQGEYRINGVTKGTQSRKERVSIRPCRCVAWDAMVLDDMAAVSTADGHSTTGIS